MSNKTKKKKVTFFDNYDLYSDANPKDTIRVHYKTLKELKETIKNLEKIYKEGKVYPFPYSSSSKCTKTKIKSY